MADNRQLEKKSKKGHISGTIWLIVRKYGMMMQIGPTRRTKC